MPPVPAGRPSAYPPSDRPPTRAMIDGMKVTTRFGLPAVIASTRTGITTGRHRRRPRPRWRIPVVAFAAALLLAVAPTSAFAASQPSLTITLFDDVTVVVGGDQFPANSDVALTASLVYSDGTSY